MGNIGFYALRDLGLALRDELNINTFIETGTYKAKTTQWAAEHFKKVISIEANVAFNKRAKEMFKDKKHVRCVLGDSLEQFPKVINRLRKPAILWLDAHKCRFEDSLTASECPLEAELNAIKETDINHIILIDDARLFLEPPPAPYDPAQWPDMDALKAMLPSGYTTFIWNDAVIAVPPEAVKIVERFTTPKEMQVVVLTSNNYVHCLPGFSYLFNKFWDAGQPVQVVRYDVRPPKMPGNFTNFAIGPQDDYTWSSGLLKYLTYHQSPLILLMLEDYFIDKPVDKAAIKRLWKMMQDNPEIAKIDLSNDRLKVAHSDYDNGRLILSDENAVYQTSVQAAIWRVDYLKRFLDPLESPWQFERRGTKRVIKARKAGTFAGKILGCKVPPVSYVNAKGGEGTQADKWDFKKVPQWMVSELRGKRLI